VSDPDLNLSIDWLTDGKKIDFETEPRFIQQSDFSLSISKTTELDSGSYTCVASTELDEVKESATLIVQGACFVSGSSVGSTLTFLRASIEYAEI
jgi:hypothetical protein